MREVVKTKSLAGHQDVVSNVRFFPNELVRFDDKAGNIPTDQAQHAIGHNSRKKSTNNPRNTGASRGIDHGDDGPKDKSYRDDQESTRFNVSIRVVHAIKQSVMIEQQLEPLDEDSERKDKEKERSG